MIARQFLRQYAHAAGVDEDVAAQEVVLTYVLQRIGELALWRRLAFKGSTSLRKTVFGDTGRFSRDIDLLPWTLIRPNRRMSFWTGSAASRSTAWPSR